MRLESIVSIYSSSVYVLLVGSFTMNQQVEYKKYGYLLRQVVPYNTY